MKCLCISRLNRIPSGGIALQNVPDGAHALSVQQNLSTAVAFQVLRKGCGLTTSEPTIKILRSLKGRRLAFCILGNLSGAPPSCQHRSCVLSVLQ